MTPILQKRARLAVLGGALALLVVAGAFWLRRRADPAPETPVGVTANVTEIKPNADGTARVVTRLANSINPLPTVYSATGQLTSAAVVRAGADGAYPPEALAREMDSVNLMLRDFNTVNGQMPAGSNAEIMRALKGKNPGDVIAFQPEGLVLNARGELVDPWGVPYFFHLLASTHMQIISAGPDHRMGTEDDLTVESVQSE